MKIVISTDSRGIFSVNGGQPWVSHFKSNNKQHKILLTKEDCVFFTSIFDHLPLILNTGKSDVIIVQLGYHEYVVPWIKACLKDIAIYDPDYENHLTPFPDASIGSHLFKKTFHYRNDDVIRKVFLQIKQQCKKLIFISMPYSWGEFKDKTIMMNNLYSSCCDSTIWLPMDPDFPKKNTQNDNIDRVHYTNEYAKYIAKLVEKEIKNV